MDHVSERIRATFGNLLNSEASKILFDITDGKYEKVVIGQDMKVRVYADEREIQLESVSRGTIEQIYLHPCCSCKAFVAGRTDAIFV